MRITDKYVFFWGEEFSNFFPCTIKYEHNKKEYTFSSSEQLFMWLKAKTFKDDEIAREILKADTPHNAKKLGRKVRGFDTTIWEEHREIAMRLAVWNKFSQNQELRNFFLDERFDNKIFVEASPFDKIWGIGLAENDELADDEKNWKGLNLLGKCLNNVREELIATCKL